MVPGEQAAAILNRLPGDDAQADVEASPELLAVCRWYFPSLLGQFSSPRIDSTA